MSANLEKLKVATRLEKVSFHFNPKEYSNYPIVVLISQASKVMVKILQARFQRYVNWELPDVYGRFRKGRGTRYLIANIQWVMEKAGKFQKNIYFYFID